MKRLQLYKELRRHRKIADKRALDSTMNKNAKIMVYIGISAMLLYLIFFAIMFSLAINNDNSTSALEFIFTIAPFILAIDFGVRFISQQTPAQLVKPYLLLPVSRYICTEAFITSSLFTWGNAIWYALLLPYCLMSVLFSYGIWATILFLCTFYVLFLINSQWYLICRTLIGTNMLWVLLPVAVYATIALPWLVVDFDYFTNIYGSIGILAEKGNPLPLVIALLFLAGIVLANRKIQFVHIMTELGKGKKQTKLRTVSKFTFLNRYGELGEYLKLEIKMVIRNRNTKIGFFSAIAVASVFSILISYTNIYNDEFSKNYFCLYNFLIFGTMFITKVMSYEGNYIECLLVHKENILKLLEAKYIFYSLMLLIPFIIMIPAIIAGKFSLLQLVAYMSFTMGSCYCLLFQLAVFNRQTIPLNQKITGRNGQSNSWLPFIITMVAFCAPIGIYFLLNAFMSTTGVYIVLFTTGLIFIVSERFWMRNIYKRMMKRKYKNLEGFRATR